MPASDFKAPPKIMLGPTVQPPDNFEILETAHVPILVPWHKPTEQSVGFQEDKS
jgi:hypothetical protein